MCPVLSCLYRPLDLGVTIMRSAEEIILVRILLESMIKLSKGKKLRKNGIAGEKAF